MTNKILVTGAAGFIGAAVAQRLLEQGFLVHGIDNINDYYDVQLKQDRLHVLKNHEGFSFTHIDIADPVAMQDFWQNNGPFKKVIHLAAQAGVRYSLTNPHAYVKDNLMGHLVLLDLCRYTDGFEHFVYASSSSVYGANTKVPYSVKDHVSHPVSFYAATKLCCEIMGESYAALYQLRQSGLRFFTVYGPYGRPDMSPHIFVGKILKGEPLPVFNNGNMKRDFTYIDDIVDGVIACLSHPETKDKAISSHQVFNLGKGNSMPLMDFIKEIEKATGKAAILDYQDMQKGDVVQTYADISESREQFGYNPQTPIEVGVPKFVKWFKEYYKV